MNCYNNKLAAEENGYVLIVVLLFMVLLTVIGVAATRTSAVEMEISGNTRKYADNFYLTEGVMTESLENYKDWLTNDFLAANPEEAYFSKSDVDFDGDGKIDGAYEVLCIQSDAEEYEGDAESAGDKAKALPKDDHTGVAPPGSFYSVKHFEIRRYGITASSPGGRTVVQTGVWRAFKKSE